MSIWGQIGAMVDAIAVGYLGAGVYVVVVVLVFLIIGRRGNDKR